MPYEIIALANEPYRPSSGTEGLDFMLRYCTRCSKDYYGKGGDVMSPVCGIIGRAKSLEVDDDNYPSEWTHDDKGAPTCTAFAAVEPDEPPFINLTEPLFQ